MPIERQIMKFYIPVTVDSLGRNDSTGRAIVPVYINPQSIGIQEQKIIPKAMTKGGYSIQYWGEELTKIEVSGITGSGGIEAINILRDVYRNEIIQFNEILRQRALNIQQDYVTALSPVPGADGNTLRRSANFGDGVSAIIDDFTNNSVTNVGNGVGSILDAISDAARGIADANPASIELIPTLGAFATSIILFWHGEKFQGYFESFSVDEKASEPGHFDYRFSFTVLKRSGKRKNFMPWHRSPKNYAGEAITVSTPKEGQMLEELSIPYQTQLRVQRFQENVNDNRIINNNSITSRFTEYQSGTNNQNDVGVNRSRKLSGK